MNTHHVWRPRIDRDPLLNPFAPVTQQRSPDIERVELADIEGEEGEGKESLDSAAELSGDQPPAQK